MERVQASSKLPAEKSQGEWQSVGLAKLLILSLSWFALALRWFLTLTVATGCLYQVAASPPLHLMGFPVKPGACRAHFGSSSSILSPLTFVPFDRRFRFFWGVVSLKVSTSPPIHLQS